MLKMRALRVSPIFVLLLLAPLFSSAQIDQGALQNIASALRVHQYDTTLQLLEPALRQFPKDARLWAMQGMAFSGMRRNSESLAAYHHALILSPDYLPALEGAAQIEYEQGSKEAIPTLQHILRLRPDNPTSHAMLGTLVYNQGDCSAAVRHFAQSGLILDTQSAALRQYGACLIQLHRLDQAIGVFQKLLILNPDDSHIRARLAAIQLTTQHPQEAIATVQPLLQGQPETFVSELAAAAFEAGGDTPQAESTLRKAMSLDPDSVDLYIDFACLAFDHQSFASGIEMMSSGLRVHPDAAALYLERGILYVQISDFQDAEADFEKASQLDPQQTLSGVARGKVAQQKGDFDGAMATVEKKLAESPNDAFLLYSRADILAQKGVEPGTQEFRLAVDSARKAVALQPRLVLAHDILGTLYLQAGQYQPSIEQSRRSLEYDPKDQSALYHLIVALRKTGNTGELPDLLKRLAQLRQDAAREESHRNRETQFVDPLK